MTWNPFNKTARLLAPATRSYERRLAEFGIDARSVFWRSDDYQLIRFETLYGFITAEDEARGGVSVADFGCGYGGFFDFLADSPALRGGTFRGYDISARMIDAARAHIDDPRAKFRVSTTVTEPADYVFACGTFNMRMGADEDEWADYVMASLRQLWSQTKKGLAFNLLRRDSDDHRSGVYPSLYYADGERFLRFCRREMSAEARVTDDRPVPDYSFYVRRE